MQCVYTTPAGLCDGHHGQTDFDLALNRLHLFQGFPNGMASAFASVNPLESRIIPTLAGSKARGG